jgi:hypothetical protein
MPLMFVGFLMILAGVFVLQAGRAAGRSSGAMARPAAGPMARPEVPRPPVAGGAPMPTQVPSGKAGEFASARLGQTITYNHPKRGGLTGKILGTARYAELWQRRKAPNEPWVETGNTFTAHWLGDTLLYEWKGSLFLLDSYDMLTDAEVKTQFLPHAQAFGRSDETADISFAYPPASWRITDIGKFRVASAEGQGLRLQAGAVGRFIHARGNTGNEGQALVVEDYQEGGGGQDTAWIGWSISWDDVQNIR